MNIGLILLAAGGSTRLGSPKKLLPYRGRSLLRHAAETALSTTCRPVLVVLGSEAARLQQEIAGLDAQPVTNPDWHQGMGTSIRRGIETLETLAPGLDGVLLMLCDQPLLRPETLASLVQTFREKRETCDGVAAGYDGTRGVPALFGRTMFAGLRALPDETGAKALLRQPGANIIEIPLPEAATDIDTREQYEKLNAVQNPEICPQIRARPD